MNFFITFLCFVFYVLIGTHAECNDKKAHPQCFMHIRDISCGDPCTSEDTLIQKNYGQKQIIEEVTRSPQNAQRSMEVPLVSLGNHFYYFVDYFKANFFTAFQFCRDHGMDLLSIETIEENELIIDYLKYNQTAVDHLWTSGTDLAQEGKFVWLSTGKKYSFNGWKYPEPDNAGKVENCMKIVKLSINNYVWNDVVCKDEYYFMCEVSKRPCSHQCC